MMANGGFGVLGEGPEVEAVHETGKAGAGMARPPRHHVLPQELEDKEAFFALRGFRGKAPKELTDWLKKQGWFKGKWNGRLEIDNFTIELEESAHQAVHGGGNRQLAREWPGEWNRLVRKTIEKAEHRLGHRLDVKGVLEEVKALMTEQQIDGPFVPYEE